MQHASHVSHVLSRYAVASDPLGGGSADGSRRILLSTRSGALMLLSAGLYEALHGPDLDRLPEPVLERLRAARLIVPAAEDELAAVIAENQQAIADDAALYQVVQPTAHCQLGCGYCGQLHANRRLDAAAQDGLLARLEAKLRSSRYTSLRVGWFGAEPLAGLAVIRSLSPRLRQLAESSGCGYSAKIVTNGLAFTPEIAEELVREHGVNAAEITLDGLAEHHDRRRHTKRGNGTFERIFANLCAVARRTELPLALSVRCNVDRSNADGVGPLIERLAAERLQSRIRFYVAPIHDWGNTASQSGLGKEDFAARELEWLSQQLQLGFPVGLVPARRKIVCMAVERESELVDAYGETFNCSEVSYVPKYGRPNLYAIGAPPAGTEEEAGAPARSPARALQQFNDDILRGAQKPCASCPMLPVCGGACPKSWREGGVPCPTPKFNIRGRLQLLHARMRIARGMTERSGPRAVGSGPIEEGSES